MKKSHFPILVLPKLLLLWHGGPKNRVKEGVPVSKGGFYSEGTDTFVISSNRLTLLFS